MAGQNIFQSLNFYKTGDTVCIVLAGDFAVKNNGPGIASNVVLTITMPTGMQIAAGMSAVARGTFDEGTLTWTIGSMIAGETVDASFCFDITDDCQGPYTVTLDITSDPCDCNLQNNQLCYILEGTSCCDIAGCTVVVDNLYTTNGTLTANRVLDGGGFDLDMQSIKDFTLQGTGNFTANFDTNMTIAVSGNVSFDSGAGVYTLLTAPADDPTQTKGLVRNVTSGNIETVTISHGSYADDAAAAIGSVPVGGHYYNTTTGVMHTRMA